MQAEPDGPASSDEPRVKLLLVPASAAAARTAGHGPVAVLPLFSGAQKRAASVIAQQVGTLKQWHECMFALAQLTWLHSCLCLFHSLL